MNKTAVLTEIYEDAFKNELEKIAFTEDTEPAFEYSGRKGVMRALGALAGGATGVAAGKGIKFISNKLSGPSLEKLISRMPRSSKNRYAAAGALLGALGSKSYLSAKNLGILGALAGGVAGDIKASQSFIKSRVGKDVSPMDALIQDTSQVKLRRMLHGIPAASVGAGIGALAGMIGGAKKAKVGAGIGTALGGLAGIASGTLSGAKKLEEHYK